jgi:hypothetical protein
MFGEEAITTATGGELDRETEVSAPTVMYIQPRYLSGEVPKLEVRVTVFWAHSLVFPPF